MRHWWVNQNQTFRHELAGGYLWSPKRNKNGARNPFYDCHCKPWRDSTNEERLDGENGLLLTPNADHPNHLLDRGFIGFERNGDLLVSPSQTKSHYRSWVSTLVGA
jgi:hypothetical protein